MNTEIKFGVRKDIESHRDKLKVYLPQENKVIVKVKPVLFGKDNSFSLQQYEQRIVDLHFVLLFMPINVSLVPSSKPFRPLTWSFRTESAKDYTRVFMKKFSKDRKIAFDWVAAIHTDKVPHLHILINGIDTNGNPITKPFSKNFIDNRIYKIAKDANEINKNGITYKTGIILG